EQRTKAPRGEQPERALGLVSCLRNRRHRARLLFFEADRLSELGLADDRETVSRIDLASDFEKEIRKGFGRLPPQWIYYRGYCDRRREFFSLPHGHHLTEPRVGLGKIAREVVKNDPDIGTAAGDRIEHITVLDPQTARES